MCGNTILGEASGVFSFDGVVVVTRKSPRSFVLPRNPTIAMSDWFADAIRTKPLNGRGNPANPWISSRNSARWPAAGTASEPVIPVDDPSRRESSKVTVVAAWDELTTAIPLRREPSAADSTYRRNAFPVLLEGTPASETVTPLFLYEKTATPTGAAFP